MGWGGGWGGWGAATVSYKNLKSEKFMTKKVDTEKCFSLSLLRIQPGKF